MSTGATVVVVTVVQGPLGDGASLLAKAEMLHVIACDRETAHSSRPWFCWRCAMDSGFTWSLNVEPEVATEYAGTTLRDYFTNPDILVQTEVAARRAFYDLYGYDSPQGNRVHVFPVYYAIACILGAQLIFPPDASPQIDARVINDVQDIGRLAVVDDIKQAGYVADAIRQYEYLKERSVATGMTPVFSLNCQSPLGTAIVLRGTSLFEDVMTEPAAIKDLLHIITETALRVIRFQEQFTGQKVTRLGMDDDYGGLVSPATYEEFNFPYIQRIFDESGAEQRHLHSETLAKGHLRFIRRLGLTSYDAWPYHGLSIGDVREELPGAFFTWNSETTKDLLSDTPDQIRAKFNAAVAAGAPGMVLDLCARGVPAENIRAFVQAAREHVADRGAP